MELGLYGAVLVLLLLRKHRTPTRDVDARDTSLFFVLSGLVMTIFLSSSVITNNDFGYRAVMLPQFFLTLLAADVLGSWWTAGSAQVVTITPGPSRQPARKAASTIYRAMPSRPARRSQL